MPLTSNVSERKLMEQAPITATVAALQATMLKYELPVLPEEEQQQEKPPDLSIINNIFKSVIN